MRLTVGQTQIIVAMFGALAIVVGAWVTTGRHVKAVRRQVTPRPGRPNSLEPPTLADEVAELRHDHAALARALGEHLADGHTHRAVIALRQGRRP